MGREAESNRKKKEWRQESRGKERRGKRSRGE
jgi:hypothetical protein